MRVPAANIVFLYRGRDNGVSSAILGHSYRSLWNVYIATRPFGAPRRGPDHLYRIVMYHYVDGLVLLMFHLDRMEPAVSPSGATDG